MAMTDIMGEATKTTYYDPTPQPAGASTTVNTPSTPSAPNVLSGGYQANKGLSQAGAGAIGAGVGAIGTVVGGILSGKATKEAREQAEAQSMSDIADARVRRSEDMALQSEQDRLQRREAKQANYLANAGIRIGLFQRDLQKEIEKGKTITDTINKLRKSGAENTAFQDARAQIARAK
jgi:hypothetical protein